MRVALRRSVVVGLLFGVGGVYLGAVGVLHMLDQRAVIVGVMSLAHAVLLALGIGAGAMAAGGGQGVLLGRGALAGSLAFGCIALLAIAAAALPLQSIFIELAPPLVNFLCFGLGLSAGVAALVAGGAVCGLLGSALRLAPPSGCRVFVAGVSGVIVAGVFQELIQLILQYEGVVGAIRDFLYTWEGLLPRGAGIVFAVCGAASLFVPVLRRGRTPGRVDRRRERLIWAGLALLFLAVLPLLAGAYIGQVLMLVGLYILMGMGLNLEVGLAGLLDLGFVAFFAVGAYTTALLTADSPHALMHVSYWTAMPMAVLLSVGVGVLFGLPVLGVRGDYLAVATLGLGEIVRVIVMSDFAAPLLGGAQGVLQIPKPSLGPIAFSGPVPLFYLTLACAGVAAFVAWRLENSRLGRAWMALRDDEDVAQALGINLIRSKLLAYGLGAAFAGLAGSIFAVMLSSVYPSSFQLLISINVLALIIVGGMGSLAGVVLGAIALIGLPELLREFGDDRYLFYGAVLIVMMRLKPEGLWPSEVRRRELHVDDASSALDQGVDLVPAQPGE
ncbi:MAG TPA: branched-chain amino acid ABC transporter permease [Acetobacteraceae bacterium]|nr:branched-chain amino acid ABC transporter permease [Acetobacteraceae bacterium]